MAAEEAADGGVVLCCKFCKRRRDHVNTTMCEAEIQATGQACIAGEIREQESERDSERWREREHLFRPKIDPFDRPF